jgi:hypothetical protein
LQLIFKGFCLILRILICMTLIDGFKVGQSGSGGERKWQKVKSRVEKYGKGGGEKFCKRIGKLCMQPAGPIGYLCRT